MSNLEGKNNNERVFTDAHRTNDQSRKRDKPSSSDSEFNDSVTSELTVLRADMRHRTSQIESVLTMIGQVSGDLATLLTKLNEHDSKFQEVNDKLDKQNTELTSTKEHVKVVENKLKVTETRLRTLEGQMIDQEARSRRNNLLFFGVQEKEGEHCTAEVKNIIKNELKLNPAGMLIQRAHRLGGPKTKNAIGQSTNRPRPIIVNFLNYNDKEEIRAARHKLRRPLGISEDFPLPIKKARDSLVPELLELKNRGKKATILYPARLMSEGKIVRVEDPVNFKTH